MNKNNIEDNKKILEDIKEYLGDIGRDIHIIRGSVVLLTVMELLAMRFILTIF